VGGLGGAIPAGPGGVVVVAGLDNVPGCGGGGVVPPELTSGLLGGGLPPLEEGLLLLPEDVSAYAILAAVAPLTINATITRKNPKPTENSAIFSWLVLPTLYQYHLS
jgi:hypothetical protein